MDGESGLLPSISLDFVYKALLRVYVKLAGPAAAPYNSASGTLRRIGPVVTELVRAGLPVSIDTMRARVAEFAGNVRWHAGGSPCG